MIQKFFLAFIPVFVAIDPIGLVAIFMGLGTSASREQRKRQAFLGIFTASLRCDRICFSRANYFRRAWNHRCRLSGRRRSYSTRPWPGANCSMLGRPDRGGSDEFGVVPLGMPLIAGPALLTALLDSGRYGGHSFHSRLARGQSGVWSHWRSAMPIGSRAGWACKDYAAYRKLLRSSSPRLRSALSVAAGAHRPDWL